VRKQVSNLLYQKVVNRVKIYFEDGSSMAVTATVAYAKNIKTGTGYETSELATFRYLSIEESLLTSAFHLIAIRPRSTAEIKRKLLQRFAPLAEQYALKDAQGLVTETIADSQCSTLINKTIQELEKRGYVNDVTFTEWWIKNRVELKPRGRYALQAELLAKGVSKDTVEKVFEKSQSVTPEVTSSMIDTLIEKIWKSIAYKKPDKRKAKEILSRRLLAKGFSWDEMGKKIDEFISKRYN
jgi:SOS response regulatory protein OraA/RecX